MGSPHRKPRSIIQATINRLENEASILRAKGKNALAESFEDRIKDIKRKRTVMIATDTGRWFHVSIHNEIEVIERTKTGEGERIKNMLNNLTPKQKRMILEHFNMEHLIDE